MSGEERAVLPDATGTPPASTGTRVILVDSRPERRAVLRSVMEHSDVAASVMGEAGDAAGAMLEVEHHNADLVVVDLQSPVEDGLATVAALRSRFPGLVILVCSFATVETMRQRVLDGGADGYLLKPVSAREVMAAMRDAPLRARTMEAATAPR